MLPSPKSVAARYLTAQSWMDGSKYEDLLSGIEQYDAYDALVHSGYSKAVRALQDALKGQGHRSADEILGEFKDALDQASRLPGTAKAVAYARKNGLGPLQKVHKKMLKIEALRAEIARDLDKLRA